MADGQGRNRPHEQYPNKNYRPPGQHQPEHHNSGGDTRPASVDGIHDPYNGPVQGRPKDHGKAVSQTVTRGHDAQGNITMIPTTVYKMPDGSLQYRNAKTGMVYYTSRPAAGSAAESPATAVTRTLDLIQKTTEEALRSSGVSSERPHGWKTHTVDDIAEDHRKSGDGVLIYADGRASIWKNGRIVGYYQNAKNPAYVAGGSDGGAGGGGSQTITETGGGSSTTSVPVRDTHEMPKGGGIAVEKPLASVDSHGYDGQKKNTYSFTDAQGHDNTLSFRPNGTVVQTKADGSSFVVWDPSNHNGQHWPGFANRGIDDPYDKGSLAGTPGDNQPERAQAPLMESQGPAHTDVSSTGGYGQSVGTHANSSGGGSSASGGNGSGGTTVSEAGGGNTGASGGGNGSGNSSGSAGSSGGGGGSTTVTEAGDGSSSNGNKNTGGNSQGGGSNQTGNSGNNNEDGGTTVVEAFRLKDDSTSATPAPVASNEQQVQHEFHQQDQFGGLLSRGVTQWTESGGTAVTTGQTATSSPEQTPDPGVTGLVDSTPGGHGGV